ncbi:MAG: dihydrolipoamide acetyltransferase family protein [Gemmatimonadaceae bacterium]
MARIDVVMPQMGESIAEGTLSKWLKKVGDTVKRDEPIFEISTDKVDAEIPAPNSGVLVEVLVTEGQTVPVQALVARIETDAAAAAAAPPAAPTPPSEAPRPVVAAPVAAAAPTQVPVAASPVDGVGTLEDRLRSKSSPLVRKIAAEHGIELTTVAGSGIAGRVTKKDILAFIESGPAAGASTAPRPSMYVPQASDYQVPAVTPWPGDVVEPMSKIRRITADHMVYSKHTSAHVTSVFEIDLARVNQVRNALRRDFESRGEKLTVLPFVIQAVIRGLQKFPMINAAVRGSDIVYRKTYNIGIAVAVDWGLIVPVIKNADNLSLAGLTRSLNDLANRARTKKLKPEEVQDATFTITNPGVFGSQWGTPVIPQPTVAILATGTIEKRPKVITGPDGADVLAIRTCAYFALSFDHRIVDGADSDKFMAFVKQQLETIPDGGF